MIQNKLDKILDTFLIPGLISSFLYAMNSREDSKAEKVDKFKSFHLKNATQYLRTLGHSDCSDETKINLIKSKLNKVGEKLFLSPAKNELFINESVKLVSLMEINPSELETIKDIFINESKEYLLTLMWSRLTGTLDEDNIFSPEENELFIESGKLVISLMEITPSKLCKLGLIKDKSEYLLSNMIMTSRLTNNKRKCKYTEENAQTINNKQ